MGVMDINALIARANAKPVKPEMGVLGDYKSATDANNNLLPGFKLNAAPAVNYSADIASNPWVKMMMQMQGLQQDNQMDQLGKDSNAGVANAYSSMATHGGVSQGARERIATKSARDAMMGRQDILRNSDAAKLGITTQGLDKQKDLDLANRTYNTGVDQFNVGNVIKNKAASDEWSLKKYEEQMKAWAADRTADAQQNSGKK